MNIKIRYSFKLIQRYSTIYLYK